MKNVTITLCTILILLSACGMPAATQTPNPNGNWLVSEDESSFDNSKTVTLLLDADKPVKAWLDEVTPTLIIRCKESDLDVYIHNDTVTEPESGKFEQATVRVRLDDRTASVITMNQSSDGKALFFPDTSIVYGIAGAETMLYEFTPFNVPPVETTFTLTGIKSAIQTLNEQCNILPTRIPGTNP